MSGVKTYLPDEVVVTFLGVPLSGFADGDFITVSPNSEGWTKQIGADGEVARSRTNDFTHNVEVTLMQTSESNLYMSGIAEADRISGTGKGPLSVTDLSGNSLHFWAEAWIEINSDDTFGKETGDRTWKLTTGQSSLGSNIVGGN